MQCSWQTEYGTGTGDKLCGKSTRSGFLWCDEHIAEANSNYPHLLIPRTAEHYDYAHQAWIDANGKYLCCAHPKETNCNCYGRIHYGEDAPCMCGKGEKIYGCPVHGIRGTYYED